MSLTDQSRCSRKKLIDIIQKDNCIKLKVVLQKIAQKTVNTQVNGWFPFHEVVDGGCTCCLNEFVKYADRKSIDILSSWDQKSSFCRRYGKEEYIMSFKKSLSLQPSFLTIAALKGDCKMIDCLAPLYNSKTICYDGISEAMFSCVSQPKIFKHLLLHFPEYMNECKESLELLCWTVSIAPLENIVALLELNSNRNHRMYDAIDSQSVIEAGINRSCASKTIDFLKVLLDAGVPLNSTTSNPLSLRSIFDYDSYKLPLLIAISHGSLEVTKFLIANGVDLYATKPCYLFQSVSRGMRKVLFYISAIFFAAFRNKLEILQLLVRATDRKVLGKLGLSSPVVAAVTRCNPKALTILLDAGYSVDGSLPDFSTVHFIHPWGDEMLDNMRIFLDDNSDFHRPVFSVLKILLERNVKFTSSLDADLLEYFLFYPENVAIEVLKLFIKFGLLEFIFSRETCLSKLKDFVRNQWKYVQKLHRFSPFEFAHDNQPWRFSRRDTFLFIPRFNAIIDHIGVFKSIEIEDFYLRETVPRLTESCRFVIRSSVLSCHKSLQLLNLLPLPLPIIKYVEYERQNNDWS